MGMIPAKKTRLTRLASHPLNRRSRQNKLKLLSRPPYPLSEKAEGILLLKPGEEYKTRIQD